MRNCVFIFLELLFIFGSCVHSGKNEHTIASETDSPGTGLLDTTRLASGEPHLWLDILAQNRDHVLTALEQYGAKLAAMHAAIRDGNQTELERLLALAKKNRDALGS